LQLQKYCNWYKLRGRKRREWGGGGDEPPCL
jgi:hypothetical protein